MAPLRIGINALYLIPGAVGGTEIYLRALLRALAAIDPQNRYFVFLNRECGLDLVPRASNFTAVRQRVRARFRPARILWEQTGLPVTAARLGIQVLLNPGFTAPILCPCPSVTVFHDLQHKRHPEHFRWFDLPFWRVLLYFSAQTSRVVLADSEATRADLFRYYRLPAEKVRVVPLGVDPVFFELAARRAPEPFLLSVSTLHPHKNLDGLLRAFAGFRRVHPEFRLVVAGLRGFVSGELERLSSRLGLDGIVKFTGWVPREQLLDLYARASGFVYPSTFEGFGLPVLEALAAGVPTACSDIEPLAGVSGDAAIRFDPRGAEAMEAAMLRLVEDGALRASLAAAGPRRAAGFTWTATARGTLDALRAALKPEC
jgi:glycosyltransferase involved in cell wall biosynthesis